MNRQTTATPLLLAGLTLLLASCASPPPPKPAPLRYVALTRPFGPIHAAGQPVQTNYARASAFIGNSGFRLAPDIGAYLARVQYAADSHVLKDADVELVVPEAVLFLPPFPIGFSGGMDSVTANTNATPREVAKVADPALDTLKSAYVVAMPGVASNLAEHVREALAAHGVQTTVGPMAAKPENVDFYVEYLDRWEWDMRMYLFSLDIRFRRSIDGAILAQSSFVRKQSLVAADPKKVIRQLVDDFYKSH